MLKKLKEEKLTKKQFIKKQEKEIAIIDKEEYNRKKNRLFDISYVIKISIIAFFLSIFFSYISNISLNKANIIIAVIVIIIIALIGIVFDIIGVAATSADIKPFHSMASRRIRGAKTGAWLIKNADKVSNFCNDVIGDISGVISGTAGAALSLKILYSFNSSLLETTVPLIVTALIATFVIGGKALGKSVAIKHSNAIIFFVAKLLIIFKKED